MDEYLVTVIVPVYNAEQYLKTCVESILYQTYGNLEIIIVNDGSTDASLDICNSFKYDNRVRVISKKNEGLSSTRQAGIDNANGDYVCTVDADDYIEKNFIEKMLNKIVEESSDICVCATKHHFNGSSKVFGFGEHEITTKRITLNDIKLNYCNLLNHYYMSDSWNKIYKLEFIRKSKVRFSLSKEYKGNDLLFNHLLLLHLPKISIINEALYNYNVLENTLSRRRDKQWQKGFIIILSKIIEEAEKLGYLEEIKHQLSQLYVQLMYIAAIDIFRVGYSSKELVEQAINFTNDHKSFAYGNRSIQIGTKDMEKLSLKVFSYCLENQKSYILFLFLKFRQTSLNILHKINFGN